MFLGIDLIRIVAVKAISGKTWVGPNVFDSPSQTADIQVQGRRANFIAVYADDWDREGRFSQSLVGAGDPIGVQLIFEVGVARATSISAEDTSDDTDRVTGSATLEATDHGLELQLGFISYQLIQALISTNPANPWARIFQELTEGQVLNTRVRRGGESNDGQRPQQRFASRVIILTLGTSAVEPPRGVRLVDYPLWNKLVLMLEADPALSGVGEMVRAHIEHTSGSDLPEMRLLQKAGGISYDTAVAIGLGPAPQLGPDERPPLESIKLGDTSPETPPAEHGGSHLGQWNDLEEWDGVSRP